MKIIDFEKRHLNEVVKMTIENYGSTHIADLNYLDWQYNKNPYGQAIIKIAQDEDNDQLAGQYVVIPNRLNMFKETIQGTLSLNTLTRKAYRGKGIFTTLAQEAYKTCEDLEYNYTIGFPNQNSYPGFIKKLGFKEIGRIPLLITPINLSKLVEMRINKFISYGVKPIEFLFNKKIKKNKLLVGYTLEELNESNVCEIDMLWDRVKNKYNIIGERNAEFIKWRFIKTAVREYKGYILKYNETILGYIIGSINEVEGIKSGMIVDFIIDSSCNIKMAKTLVEEIMNYFINKNATMVGALMLKHTQEYKILTSSKFYKCPKRLEPQPFIVIYKTHGKSLDDREEKILNIDNWFLTMGDYDAI